jgi:hypothetical protein
MQRERTHEVSGFGFQVSEGLFLPKPFTLKISTLKILKQLYAVKGGILRVESNHSRTEHSQDFQGEKTRNLPPAL